MTRPDLIGYGPWTAEAEQIVSLVCGRVDRETVRMVMLQGFVDDSSKSDVYLLAGLAAKAGSWIRLADEWKETLKSESVHLGYFKMSEAANCIGEFNGFSYERRDRVVNRLVGILNRYVEFGFASWVYDSEYRRIMKRIVNPLSDTPYLHLFYSIQHACIRHQMVYGPNEAVDFFFDEDARHEGVLGRWEVYKNTHPIQSQHLIGNAPIHRSDKVLIPLQAADLVAWKLCNLMGDGDDRSWKWDEVTVPINCEHEDAGALSHLASRLRFAMKKHGLEPNYKQERR